MLEDLAISYWYSTDIPVEAVNISLIILGAVLAGIIHPGTAALERAPYFAWSAIIILTFNASQLFWLQAPQAIAHGYLWLLVMSDWIVYLVTGYAIFVIAMARSRDAYGYGGMAILAFIPVANFWLLLKPSTVDRLNLLRRPTDPYFSGTPGVLMGIVAMAAAMALKEATLPMVEDRMAKWVRTDAGVATGLRAAILQQGLEATITTLAAETAVPWEIDDSTTLVAIQAEGATLRYMYFLKTYDGALDPAYVSTSIDHICVYEPYLAVIRAGGTIVESYYNLNAELIGEFGADSTACDTD